MECFLVLVDVSVAHGVEGGAASMADLADEHSSMAQLESVDRDGSEFAG